MLEFLRRMARRLGLLIWRTKRERAMDEEMRFHLEMEAAELQREGLPAEEARRRARIAFGGVERFKEEGRDTRGTRLVEDLGQDLGYAVRQLRASPGFAAATVLTLALGIGVTTMMHSYRRYIRSQESTVASPERLVSLGQGARDCARCVRMAPGNYLTIRNQSRTLEHVSMFVDWDPILRGTDHAELRDGARVTTEFFRTFDIPPMLGRTIVPDDSAADRQQVVVLTEAFWRARFEGDRSVLGQTIMLDRIPYTIVGVVANHRVYPRGTEFWVPLGLAPVEASERERADYRVVGRLREDATVAIVSAEVAGIGAQLAAEFPAIMSGSTLAASPLLELSRLGGDSVTSIYTVAVGLVLLIASINLAGLLIARLSARRRELAVRRAMGAAPGRIVRQLLAETILLTALGGACGAVVAAWGLRAVVGWTEVRLDGHAFAVALGIGLLCGLVIGLWPSVRFARPMLVDELRDRTATGSIDTARGRRALVLAEVALAIVLLSAAGLLARSVKKMYEIEPGFSADTERVLAVRMQNPPPTANTPADPERIDRLVRAIETIPGVERAGATLGLPYGHGSVGNSFEIEGRPQVPPKQRPRVRMQAATPGYFEALGIPILRGRSFTDSDRANAPRVAIINQAVAQRFFTDQNPIGSAVIIDSVRWEIVGVAGTVFHGDVEQMAPPEIYRPMQQWGRPAVWIAVRTRAAAAQISPALTAAVRQFDPDIAITRLMTMKALHTNENLNSERRMLRLMGSFALAALLISAIGLYGLISYSVAQRTREFGVRLALGAEHRAVLGLVLGQGVRLAVIGAAIGIVGALGALRVMQSMLFGVTPTDPITLASVVLVICAVALLAAYLPARRAMLVDPITSLRAE